MSSFINTQWRELEYNEFLPYKQSKNMIRALAILSVALLTIFTVATPVQAERANETFEKKQSKKLSKAEAKLKKFQLKVDCIKAAKDKEALKECD